jgi:hypothetical protein
MKLNVFIISIWGLLSFLTFSYCNSNSNKVDTAAEHVNEAQNDLEDAQQEYLREWEKFKTDTRAEIDANDNYIVTYREMEKKDPEFSTKYKLRIDELENENSRLKGQLDSYNKDNMKKDDWESFKREFRHDMDQLGNSLKNLTKDNKK